jgi:hypothetical protein
MLGLNCTQQAFHRVLVDYQKKRRKKATIQGHQILGCKYTPAKGMESCEKNEQCTLCCIVILFYYNNNYYYYYNYYYFFFFFYFFLRPNCWKQTFSLKHRFKATRLNCNNESPTLSGSKEAPSIHHHHLHLVCYSNPHFLTKKVQCWV